MQSHVVQPGQVYWMKVNAWPQLSVAFRIAGKPRPAVSPAPASSQEAPLIMAPGTAGRAQQFRGRIWQDRVFFPTIAVAGLALPGEGVFLLHLARPAPHAALGRFITKLAPEDCQTLVERWQNLRYSYLQLTFPDQTR